MQTDNSSAIAKAIMASRSEVNLPGIGRIAYYHDTEEPGLPLLLVHSINAAPSAMEMRPLFDHFRTSRPVYALDLPGFGASERADREYSAPFFASAINGFCQTVIGTGCDVVCMSLSAEFTARAALDQPDQFRSLCMISPTGLSERAMPGSKYGDQIYRFLRLPGIGAGLFKLLSSKRSIRYFLGMFFKGKPAESMLEYAWLTAHRPGARFAPFCFLSGKLFDSRATDNLYQHLNLPVLVLYDWDPNISFELLAPLAAERDNWHVVRIPNTRGLPHWEQLKRTTLTINGFWSRLEQPGEP